jgi:hypothetical protein
VCGKPPVDGLELPAVLICRRCAAALGRFLETTNDAVLAVLWRRAPRPITDTRCARLPVTPESAETHYYLGCEYAEMGMGVEAIRELAVVLDPVAPMEMAAAAFFRIFLSPEARPEALYDVITAFRNELTSPND